MSGKTLGIVGFGRIGQEMARRARFGFGMKIIVHNRSRVDASVLAEFGAVQTGSDPDDLLPECDFVSLHCPGGTGNRHLIDARRLDLMKPGAFLINTARGEVVDEAALVEALIFDAIGGAALDVFDGEPNINPALLQCDGVVLLPHLGSATREAREAMGFRVLDNLGDFFAGRDPRDRVIHGAYRIYLARETTCPPTPQEIRHELFHYRAGTRAPQPQRTGRAGQPAGHVRKGGGCLRRRRHFPRS
ncbi:NAD(P)-binding domain-containing protein [Novosphingobium sp. MW5]|nr:NAD(P)-binding domain-containing protein [Novosphingobium sp. MW5]